MSAPTPIWDPRQYLRHSGHRARAFLDLLAQVPELPANPAVGPPRIADLGCGPGNVTRLLADRWPTARITGYDNSPEMLDKARVDHEGPTPGGGRLDFAEADVCTWAPPEPYDLIVSNATLQWVPGHLARFPAWVDGLTPGGTFAFQVPGNFDSPSHRLMRELALPQVLDSARTGGTPVARWRTRLGDTLRHDDAVHAPAAYLRALVGLGCGVDAWETTYLHLLQGEDPVLDWMQGTGLRPVLTALADDPRAMEEFIGEYRQALRGAYPATAHGTVFPFRRIFVVARKRKGV